MSLFRINILLIVIFLSLNVTAQVTSGTFERIKNKYPGESIVKLKDHEYLKIDIIKGELKCQLERTEQIIFLKNIKGEATSRSVYSSYLKKLIEFEAFIYNEENGKISKKRVKTFDKLTGIDDDVFYDDLTEYKFTFPNVHEGSIIELKTVHDFSKPQLTNLFLIDDYIPVVDYQLKIDYNADIEMDFVELFHNSKLTPVEDSTGTKRKSYILLASDLNKISEKKYQTPPRYNISQLIPIINTYYYQGEKKKVLENTDDLYQFYYSFIKDLDQQLNTSELDSIVETLVCNEDTELQKVQKIYSWVQKNISYIAFEDKMGGFIPRKADLVLKRRHGDCKDMTCLLYFMLKKAGIISYFAWTGTRDLPYSYNDVYTPMCDNHMIVAYLFDDHYYYLDATGSDQMFSDIPYHIQGKEALISIDAATYQIKKIPVIPASINEISDTIFLQVDNTTIKGKVRGNFSGNTRFRIKNILSTDDDQEKKKRLQNSLQLGNNKFSITEYHADEKQESTNTLTLNYQFFLDNYATKYEQQLFINMNLDRSFSHYKLSNTQPYAFKFNHTIALNRTYLLELPENTTVSYMPENKTFESGKCSFSCSYEADSTTLTYRYNVTVDQFLFNEKDYEAWQEFIKNIDNVHNESIILTTNENKN